MSGNSCKDQEKFQQLQAVIDAKKGTKGALMPVMQEAQAIFGYLPKEVQQFIADGLGVTLSEVYGVATFYAQFVLEPQGEHVIGVCLGTACYVKGSQAVLDRLAEELKVPVGKTTADGKFTLNATRCLGACGLAPVMMIGDEVYGRSRPTRSRESWPSTEKQARPQDRRERRKMRELSLHILDLAQNSLTANATRLDILIRIDHEKDNLSITLADNGKGMAPDFLKSVTSPFTTTRTTRKVGLGIPMFKANAELTGGSFDIESEVGVGTRMTANFVLSSIDRPPLGDMPSTMVSLVVANPEFHFHLEYAVDKEAFVFDTEEIRQVLGGVPLDTPEVLSWIEGYIQEGMESLHGGA